MEFDLNHFAESFDLRTLHWITSYIGIFLCAGAIQVWRVVGAEIGIKSLVIAGIRRAGLALAGLGFIWSIYYASGHPEWQPWPPDCLMLVGVDCYLFAVVAGSYIKWYSQQKRAAATATSRG